MSLNHTLVAVDHSVDHVLLSVLHGFVEEGRFGLVQDELCSSIQQEPDCGHVALSRCQVESSVLSHEHKTQDSTCIIYIKVLSVSFKAI